MDVRKSQVIQKRQPSQVIIPQHRALWEDRGWSRTEEWDGTEIYRGEYRAKDTQIGQVRNFIGRIEIKEGVVKTYICFPPIQAYQQHPKYRCFHKITRNHKPDDPVWFKLNWDQDHRPTDPDTAILVFEQVLYESMQIRPVESIEHE